MIKKQLWCFHKWKARERNKNKGSTLTAQALKEKDGIYPNLHAALSESGFLVIELFNRCGVTKLTLSISAAFFLLYPLLLQLIHYSVSVHTDFDPVTAQKSIAENIHCSKISLKSPLNGCPFLIAQRKSPLIKISSAKIFPPLVFVLFDWVCWELMPS